MIALSVARKGEEDKRKMFDIVEPGELVITMRARDLEDKVDAIRHIFTFDEIQASNRKLFQFLLEDILARIVSAPA
jgi:hypothetical protein